MCAIGQLAASIFYLPLLFELALEKLTETVPMLKEAVKHKQELQVVLTPDVLFSG